MKVKWILESWIPASLLKGTLGQGEMFFRNIRVQFYKQLHAHFSLKHLRNTIKWVGLLMGPELDMRLF